MLKSILLFIKAHAVATAITTTVVVSTAVTTPIVVSNYILDKNVKENLSMLAPSNFQVDENNTIIENNQAQNEEKTVVDTNAQLTFRIEKVHTKTEGGNIVKDMQGNDAYEMSSEETTYKIVPSYDKDYSKWTTVEKKMYQKALEDATKMAEEEYKNNVKSEEEAMKEAMMVVETVKASQSKDYMFLRSDGWSESWSYNSYLKLYSSGVATQNYGEDIWKTRKVLQGECSGVFPEDFKSIVYPTLKKEIEDEEQKRLQQQIKDNPAMAESPSALNEFKAELKKTKQKALNDLEELYHLSD